MILNLSSSDIQRCPRLSGAIEYLLGEGISLIPQDYVPALVEVYFDNQIQPAYTIVSGKIIGRNKVYSGVMPDCY